MYFLNAGVRWKLFFIQTDSVYVVVLRQLMLRVISEQYIRVFVILLPYTFLLFGWMSTGIFIIFVLFSIYLIFRLLFSFCRTKYWMRNGLLEITLCNDSPLWLIGMILWLSNKVKNSICILLQHGGCWSSPNYILEYQLKSQVLL